MSNPIVSLIDRLNDSWGPPGKPGNVEEIHHITCLIRDYLDQVVRYEEQIYFANVPEEYGRLIDLLKNLLGSQAEKLAEIPDYLDEVVSLIGADHGGTIERPHVIKKTIFFDIPKEWNKQFNRELNRIKRLQSPVKYGCIVVIIIWLLIYIIITIVNSV